MADVAVAPNLLDFFVIVARTSGSEVGYPGIIALLSLTYFSIYSIKLGSFFLLSFFGLSFSFSLSAFLPPFEAYCKNFFIGLYISKICTPTSLN